MYHFFYQKYFGLNFFWIFTLFYCVYYLTFYYICIIKKLRLYHKILIYCIINVFYIYMIFFFDKDI